MKRGIVIVKSHLHTAGPMQAVLEDESRAGMKLPADTTLISEKLTIAEHTNRRAIRPNGGAETAVAGLQGSL